MIFIESNGSPFSKLKVYLFSEDRTQELGMNHFEGRPLQLLSKLIPNKVFDINQVKAGATGREKVTAELTKREKVGA